MNELDLRNEVRRLFDIGVKAADPALAVRRELQEHPLAPIKGRYHLIAIGKAAIAMMKEALAHLPHGAEYHATAVTNSENAVALENVTVFATGHPIPDENGLAAANFITQNLSTTTADDMVLCLVSGGGSALLPSPVPGITLDDKIETNRLLLGSGLDIEQMNLIRQNLSTLKGGGLSALAYPATVRSLIISDVIGDDPRAIASGPTATKIGSRAQAKDALIKSNLWDQLPQSIRTYLGAKESGGSSTPTMVTNKILASNAHSVAAIIAANDHLNPTLVDGRLGGDVSEAAQTIVDYITANLADGPQLFIWGGETTVKLRGNGIGGRNQELALRVALLSQNIGGNWAFLSGGTDGRDGPTDAAGGIVTHTSFLKLTQSNIDIARALDANDSYTALNQINDLLITVATGTNVADIQLFLKI